jgi:hypothetical protein
MIMPMDNSTDPPLRHISEATVEDELGSLEGMSKQHALDVLSKSCASHWIMDDQSEAVIKSLIYRAQIQQDLATLEAIYYIYSPDC